MQGRPDHAHLLGIDADGDPGWLIDLVAELRPRPGESPDAAVARLDALSATLAADASLARAVARLFCGLIPGRTQRHLLSESGVESGQGFLSELFRRACLRILPETPNRLHWIDLIGEVFAHRDDRDWVALAGEDRWARLIEVLWRHIDAERAQEPDGLCARASRVLRTEALEALRMLTHRLAALGVDPELLRYNAPAPHQGSPFLAQADEMLRCLTPTGGTDVPGPEGHGAGSGLDEDAARHLAVLLDQCNEALLRTRKLARQQGASIALTRLVLRGRATIRRMSMLLLVLRDGDADARAGAGGSLLIDLVKGESRRHGVRDLVLRSTDLLALQVTENASRTGEHYITTTRAEYWAMARSAAGAGIIVGAMALIKIWLAALHLPPFWEAFLFGVNYAAGFVVVHLLHFTIATKQPAMTAARIASAAEEASGRKQALDRIAELTAQITRTQIVAILGNVAVAFPVALVIALGWHALTGAHAAEPAKAVHMLGDSHPWRSLALVHAAIAGVCLYLAGLISGYYDNRCVYGRVPERLRRVEWLQRSLGTDRAERLAAYVENNLGALAGNVAFGFMLGFVGFFGSILGLPLDIRHVTFSSANAGFGLVGLDFAVSTGTILITTLGIAMVGLTNLGVSFSLALYTAMKARGLRVLGGRDFLAALRSQWRAQPFSFLLPPR